MLEEIGRRAGEVVEDERDRQNIERGWILHRAVYGVQELVPCKHDWGRTPRWPTTDICGKCGLTRVWSV